VLYRLLLGHKRYAGFVNVYGRVVTGVQLLSCGCCELDFHFYAHIPLLFFELHVLRSTGWDSLLLVQA
jgi:hypothetical protein